MEKTAIVVGVSGLTGSFLLSQLIDSEDYNKVIALVRRKLDRSHPKLQQIVFNNISDIQKLENLSAGVMFCCLGTTIKKAGSRTAFFEVDHDLVVESAKTAIRNQITSFIVVSSTGANAGSRNFYLKVKGKMELELDKLGFRTLIIFRPSLLLGIRNEYRFGEEMAKGFAKKLPCFFRGTMKKYAPVHASDVAKAMLKSSLSFSGRHIIESQEILGIIAEK